MSTESRQSPPSRVWPTAARLLSTWLQEGTRLDHLFNHEMAGLTGLDRARCQQLVFTVVRHRGRLDAWLEGWWRQPPRAIVHSILLLAGAEMLDADEAGREAKVVHHAVSQAKSLASIAESRLVNALARKLVAALPGEAEPADDAGVIDLARYYSHPAWLVQRWLEQYGVASTRALLNWNQLPGRVYGRWRGAEDARPDWLEPTPWEGFWGLPTGAWPKIETELGAGRLVIQDPATRLAVDMLDAQNDETLLDACAAPGGKSVAIGDRLDSGTLVALDVPGPRQKRLQENLAWVRGVKVVRLVGDLLRLEPAALAEAGVAETFDGILLDVPCTNTGVMRHRVDVKWRLQPADFDRHAEQQAALLDAAASLVRPGGRIIYSTCSVDDAENGAIVRGFLAAHPEFSLTREEIALPWQTGHDGAGVFRLERDS